MPEKFGHLLPSARGLPMSPRRSSIQTSKRFSRLATVVVVLLVFWLFPKDWLFTSWGVEDRHEKSLEESLPGTVAVPEVIKPKSQRKNLHIVTFTTKQTSYQHLAHRNKHGYARLHGYDITIDYIAEDPDGVLFHKFGMIEKLIDANTHDWIWWVDWDTLITNMSIPLMNTINEELAEAEKASDINFLFTADCFELNAGSMIVRSTPQAKQFLQDVRVYHRANKDTTEQDAIRDLIRRDQGGCNKHIRYVPQWKINAFPPEIKCWDKAGRGWEPGVFLVHFAGAWAHIKDDDPYGFLMRKYEPFVHWEGY